MDQLLSENDIADSTRRLNEAIADNYDRVLYDEPGDHRHTPASLFGLAALYGCVPASADVLDLGCGTGRQLGKFAAGCSGRLVGIDASAEALALAKVRCAPYADRAQLIHADFLDVRSADLGTFDVIINIGVFYVTPFEVRRHLLRLIGECLRPGGFLVTSYYTGTWALVRSSVHRLLRAMDNPDDPIDDRIAAARRHLTEMVPLLSDQAAQAYVAPVVRSVERMADTTLFHEALNPTFDILDTIALSEQLSPYGLQFLSYTSPTLFGILPTAKDRLVAAAKSDFMVGGYRYALFGKTPDGSATFDIRSPHVRWKSFLHHQPDAKDPRGVSFKGTLQGQRYLVEAAVTGLSLIELEREPRT